MLRNRFVRKVKRGIKKSILRKDKHKVGLSSNFEGNFDFSNYPLAPHEVLRKELIYSSDKIETLAKEICIDKTKGKIDENVLTNIEYILYRMDNYGININLIPYCFNEKGHYVLPLINTDDLSYEDWIKLNENSIPNLKELLTFLDTKNTVKGFKLNLYISCYLEGKEDTHYEGLDDLLTLCSENLSLWIYDAPTEIKEEFKQRTDSLLSEYNFIQSMLNSITYVTLDGPGNLTKKDWAKIRDTLLQE